MPERGAAVGAGVLAGGYGATSTSACVGSGSRAKLLVVSLSVLDATGLAVSFTIDAESAA